MHNFFDMASLNVIWQLVCGRRFDYNDENLLQMIEHIEAFTMERFIGPIVGTKALKYVPPFDACYASVKNHMAVFKAFLSNIVSDAKKTSESGVVDDSVVNYVSAFFGEQSNAAKMFFSDKQLVISMQVSFFEQNEKLSISSLSIIYIHYKSFTMPPYKLDHI